MPLNKDTVDLQNSLADYCRSKTESVNVERPDRLYHYRRLVFNNVYNVVESAYPITKELVGKSTFKSLVDRFFTVHDPKNPQYWKMPYEVIEYTEKNEKELIESYPYLVNLLQFEWAEIQVYAQPNIKISHHNVELTSVLGQEKEYHITPYHSILELDYPVHELKNGNTQLQEQTTFMIAYRSENDFDVHYYLLTPLSVLLLNILTAHAMTFDQLCAELKRITSFPSNVVVAQTHELLAELLRKKIISKR